MEIKRIDDPAFNKYGKVIEGIDFGELIEALLTSTPLPEGVVYEPGVPALESLPVYEEISSRLYGELPVEIGYCNGHNHLLNAVEYHRSSEVNVAATDMILLLGAQQDITPDYTYDTSLMEAFLVPAGTAVEVYATTLHYAPCSVGDEGFKVGVILPEGTNLPLEATHAGGEDALITAKNKWLIGHPEGGLPEGTHIGLVGANLDCRH